MDARGRLDKRPRVLREFFGVVLRRRRLYRVTGRSMTPTLFPGDVVAVRPSNELPEPGEIVVLRHPRDPSRTLVKRARSRGERSFAVGSDAPDEASDSRHFGSLGLDDLLGRALWSWSPGRGFQTL